MERNTKMEEAVKTILQEMGEDVTREGLRDTPKRVAAMFLEVSESLGQEPPKIALFTNEEKYDQMVTVDKIKYFSMCEHHLVTFFGTVAVGYLPDKKYIGLSKIPRIVKYFASKPQIQEKLTQEIADYLFDTMEPIGLIVVVTGEHMCVGSRGAKQPGVITTTCAIKGNIDKNEFFTLIGK